MSADNLILLRPHAASVPQNYGIVFGRPTVHSYGHSLHGVGTSMGRPVVLLPPAQYQRPMIYVRPRPIVLHASPVQRIRYLRPAATSVPAPMPMASPNDTARRISYDSFVPNHPQMSYPTPMRSSASRGFEIPAGAVSSAQGPPVVHHSAPPAHFIHSYGTASPEVTVQPVPLAQPTPSPGRVIQPVPVPNSQGNQPQTQGPRTFGGDEAGQKAPAPDEAAKEDVATEKPNGADFKIPLTPGPQPDQAQPKRAESPQGSQNDKPQPVAKEAAANVKDVAEPAEHKEPEVSLKPKPKPSPKPKSAKPKSPRSDRKKSPELETPVLAWNLPDSLRTRQSRTIASDEIASRDHIRIDAHNGLDLQEGWVQFPNSSKNLLSGIQKSKQLLIVARVTCKNDDQKGPARIVSCSQDANARNFTLAQDGRQFVVRIRSGSDDANGTKHETSFGRVQPGTEQHVAVRYDGRELECYVDGELVAERKFKTDFKSWERFPVVAGNEFTADRPWAGTIHSLAVLPTSDRRQLDRLFEKK